MAAAPSQRHVIDEALGMDRIRQVERDRGADSVDAARTGGGFHRPHRRHCRPRRCRCRQYRASQSAPPAPFSVLAAALPVSPLASALPVALMAAVPISVTCSIAPLGMGRVREAETDGGHHQIVSVRPGDALVDHVAGIVDGVDVGAGKAAHEIGAAAAVDRIDARISDEDVDEFVAGEIDRADVGAGSKRFHRRARCQTIARRSPSQCRCRRLPPR